MLRDALDWSAHEAVAAFLAGIAFGSEGHRLVPARANRQPAFGVHRGDGPDVRPFAIHVVRFEAGLVAEMDLFLFPRRFPAFGLPDTVG